MTDGKTSLKKSILRSASFWVYWIIAIVSMYLSWQISLSLSLADYVPKENASSILKALLDAEIALVGFWAIVLVYIFNNLRGAKERVSINKHEMEIKRDEQEISLYTEEPKGAFVRLRDKYRILVDELDKEFRQLVLQTFITTITAVVTVILLFWSIFQNIYSMGLITENGLHYWNLLLCLFPLFMTFMLIFTIIIFSQPKHEFDILKQELKKQWKETKARREQKKPNQKN